MVIFVDPLEETGLPPQQREGNARRVFTSTIEEYIYYIFIDEIKDPAHEAL